MDKEGKEWLMYICKPVCDIGEKYGFNCSPYTLNTFSQLAFFVVFGGVIYVGIWDVLTYLYTDHTYVRTAQAIGWFITFQMSVNWLCIRYVDSSYKPAIHGTNPSCENNVAITMTNGADDACHAPVSSVSNNLTQRKTVYVATSLPDADGRVQREAFDYWSWKPCVVCRRLKPPRCHHCVLCQRCVLKRDHHCFFAGSCVGVNNHRHFIVFAVWACLGCIYAFIHMAYFFYVRFFADVSYLDLFPPITFIRALFGYQTFETAFLVFLLWWLVYFIFLSGAHFEESFSMILDSQTTFEKSCSIETQDSRTKLERIRGVFGDYWLLNLLLPCHWLFPPADDPVMWPSIKQ